MNLPSSIDNVPNRLLTAQIPLPAQGIRSAIYPKIMADGVGSWYPK